MKDDALILKAWAEAGERSTSAILATVVKVSGSAYRRPGARMLVTENGGRIGSISGGCLESDVLRKAWWLTSESGAAIRVYDSSSEEDVIWEFGLGCNGIIHLLLERWDGGSQPLTVDLLTACRADRRGGVLATVISGSAVGRKVALFPDGVLRSDVADPPLRSAITEEALTVYETRENTVRVLGDVEVFFEYVSAPVPLVIVGAGQDALPVVRFAKELGWDVTVIDGRANQARPERFPQADRVLVADLKAPLRDLPIDDRTVAVLMSHSYPQDSTFLAALHAFPVRYLGVLGPRKRTSRMISEAGIQPVSALHSPVGLDIGADTPEEIALSIVSEIQASLAGRDGGMLKNRPGPIHEARNQLAEAAHTIPA